MLGHEGVVRAMVESLKANLPGIITELRTQYKAAPAEFPIPESRNIHPAWVDIVSLGRFPTLMVVQEDTEVRNTARQIEIDGVYDEFEWRYPVRVVIHNVGRKNQYGETERERKRLMLAVRMWALQNRVMFDDGHESAVVVPETIRENFTGGSINDDTKDLLLESYVRLEIRTQERLAVTPGPEGSADITYSVGLLPHPEAD